MISIIIFTILSLIIFVITFFKLIKKNNSNYIFALIPEFIGIVINFVYIFISIKPNTIVIILMYILSIIIPIIGFILEKNDINLLEIIGITKIKYYENKNQKEKVKNELLKNVQKYPNSYIYHKKLAKWYEENKEIEKAEYEYIKIVELKPKNHDNYIKLANVYIQNDKNEYAIELLNTLLKNKPELKEASILLGETLYNNNMFKEAINVYKEALKYNPSEYMIYYELGMTYTRLNDFKNAKEYYKKAATINSTLGVAKLNLGQISLLFKDYEEAEKYFMECIEIEDDKIQADAYYYLAKIKLINNQKELAIQYANIALEINPNMIKIMEQDVYFAVILGKIKKVESKNINSKITQKEDNIIKYLNNTYTVVEELLQGRDDNEKNVINKERDI